MPYKDQNKQKEANRLAMERYRKAEKVRVSRQGITKQGITPGDTQGSTGGIQLPPPGTIPGAVTQTVGAVCLPANFGQPDCACGHCSVNRANGNKHTLNHGPYKFAKQLGPSELNRVSLPGDADYVLRPPTPPFEVRENNDI